MLTNPEKPGTHGGFSVESDTVAPLWQFALAVLAVLSFKFFLAIHVGPVAFQSMLNDLAGADAISLAFSNLLQLDRISQTLLDIAWPMLR